MVYDNNFRTWKQRIIDLLLVAVPLFIWTVFSTVYYGMPLPNTAYAKLHTGVAKSVLFSQGITYVIHSAMHEPVIALSFIISLIFSFISHKKSVKVVSAGILLNLVYVVSVGGDFMVLFSVVFRELKSKEVRFFASPIQFIPTQSSLVRFTF